MKKTAPKNIGASVRERLLRLARDRGDDFQLVLTHYVNERLLARLAASRHATSFVLKGAVLTIATFVGEPLDSARTGAPLTLQWQAGGPWR